MVNETGLVYSDATTMRRADRLFQIIQILRRGRVTTAARLAKELEVSERTVYRDIRDLVCTGVPIEGEAGVGYALPRSFDLPPLMFTEDEIEALVLGARTVKSWADPGLKDAAERVLSKVEAVLPDALKARITESAIFALNFRPEPAIGGFLGLLRQAQREQRKVHLHYRRADGIESHRVVRPLCLSFTAPMWMLSGWCELRDDFRNFRLDRMDKIELLDETFEHEPGRSLEDFLRLFEGS